MASSSTTSSGTMSSSSNSLPDVSSAAPAYAMVVEALYPYAGEDANQLCFHKGDLIEVWGQESTGWWDGILIKSKTHERDSRGWFPSNYVKPLTAEEIKQVLPEKHRAQTAQLREAAMQSQAQRPFTDAIVANASYEFPSRGTTPDLLDEAGLDILLGRRAPETAASELDQLLRWNPAKAVGQETDEDLTSFSVGGDIFGEIAAAAAADHLRDPAFGNGQTHPSNHDFDSQIAYKPQPSTGAIDKSMLLPPHEIGEPASTGETSNGGSSAIDPDWVPKVSQDGRIYYYNTRTTEASYDLPSPSSSSSAGHTLASESGTATSYRTKMTTDSASTPDYRIRESAMDPFGSSPSKGRPIASGRAKRASNHSVNGSAADEQSHRGHDKSGSFSVQSADPTATPRKASIVTNYSMRTSTSKRLSNAVPWKYRAAEQAAKMPLPSTLGQLERQCADALARLSAVVHTRSEVSDNRNKLSDSAFCEEEIRCRTEMEEAAVDFNNATRRLLAATDVILEEPQHRASKGRAASITSKRSSLDTNAGSKRHDDNQTQYLPSLEISEFRPLAMKITATQSKLMLSVRTIWGLLATSPREEGAVEASRASDSLNEADVATLTRNRNVQLANRRDLDTKLRFDLLVQIRALGDAISTFVEQIESFAAKKGRTAGKHGLVVTVPVSAQVQISSESVLLPVASVGGNLRGHGFAHYFPRDEPHAMRHLSDAEHPRSRPRRTLSAAAIQDLQLDRKALVGDLSALRTIFQTLFGSHFQASSVTSSLLPTITSQTLGFLNRLARFLKEVEDIDIAAKVDISYQDMPGVQSADGSYDTRTSAAVTYATSLDKASSLLQDLMAYKRRLYGIPTRILTVIQALTLKPRTHRLSSFDMPPSQPKTFSPLACCISFESREITRAGSILDALASTDDVTSSLVSTLSLLHGIAEEQSQAPAAWRMANAELRSKQLARLQAFARKSWSTEDSPYTANYDEDVAEELRSTQDSASGPSNSGNSSRSARNSRDASGYPAANNMIRTPSLQSVLQNRGLVQQRRSRSDSVADSVASDSSRVSGFSTHINEAPRAAYLDADFRDSPSTHSPSKSKLKQFFGDDAPGQIFQRQLTKASQEMPLYLQQDYTHNDLTFAMDNSVKAGTLHALVCRLTNHMSADSQYNGAFLMTYRTFTDANELLDQLKARYYLEPPPALNGDDYTLWVEQKQKLVRARVINVIRSWLTDHLYEDDEAGLLDRISAFAVTLPKEHSQQLARIIERRRVIGTPRRMTASMSGGILPAPLLPRNFKKIKFLDVDPLEIARQFTIMDSRLFAKITVEECLAKAWPKKFGNKPTPNFTAIADLSNAVTIWVAMSIVTQTDVRRRVAIVKHFITIADKCRQLSNFTTLMHIVAGLGSSAIYRLKRTWELVNQRSMATFHFLGNLMSPENNHALYRDALRLVGSPCVPFLGVYFTDWVMSGEANSDMLRDKPDQINFAKRAKVADSIQQIQLHQATPYNLTPVPQLQTWMEDELEKASKLAQVPGSTDMMHKAYELSLVIEPREREDERIARLLSESGFL